MGFRQTAPFSSISYTAVFPFSSSHFAFAVYLPSNNSSGSGNGNLIECRYYPHIANMQSRKTKKREKKSSERTRKEYQVCFSLYKIEMKMGMCTAVITAHTILTMPRHI